ncbi:hypothetical protein PXK00_11140 [Phaeobacter sp. QD34_3]|uniref:hypothetical protein n=1 Tax=unclassified Phaeobacter TaxID=2621772 RepID=UPI00237F54A0|nr:MULTISPECIES: hypothetical protein [unclassified Phaeobacter]MDE4133672.1 hypothetical protein [Phaeobacter sp. QD34_3]MDE4137395.1 hypothetical protein [Phaeobacter sp. QD34_24]
MAEETWPGIVVRAKIGEDGTVPRSSSSQSPDIIIAPNSEPYQDPSILTDPNNYDKSYPNALNIGRPNYLYVRGKNYTEAELSGHWTLYYAEPNILLYPYLWEDNQLGTSTNNKRPDFTIGAGAIGASTDPFRWIPADVSDHYCMIAIAETPDHGNPVAGANNIDSLASVMSNNANIAQRNVQMVRGNKPQQIMDARYNQGEQTATVDLDVRFKNIPTGTHYKVTSGTPLDGEALIKTNEKDADGTTEFDFGVSWTDKTIPAQWSSLFTVELFFKSGGTWPEKGTPQVEIIGKLLLTEDHVLYAIGEVAGTDPETGAMRMTVRGGPVKTVTVGSCGADFFESGPDMFD